MTSRNRVLLAIAVLHASAALMGCDGQALRTDPGNHSAKLTRTDCRYVGNVPGRHLCATTYTHLLAHPERFDGQRIKVLAWAQPGGRGRIVLFPTAGSLGSGEVIASIVIEDDPKIPDIERFLASGNPGQAAVPVYVSGTFKLQREHGPDQGVFAYMVSLEGFGP